MMVKFLCVLLITLFVCVTEAMNPQLASLASYSATMTQANIPSVKCNCFLSSIIFSNRLKDNGLFDSLTREWNDCSKRENWLCLNHCERGIRRITNGLNLSLPPDADGNIGLKQESLGRLLCQSNYDPQMSLNPWMRIPFVVNGKSLLTCSFQGREDKKFSSTSLFSSQRLKCQDRMFTDN